MVPVRSVFFPRGRCPLPRSMVAAMALMGEHGLASPADGHVLFAPCGCGYEERSRGG